ncbi:hypothetical protein JZ751_003138, partial [Albula glossodonta]
PNQQQHLLQHGPQPPTTELQMPPPVVTLLQSLPEEPAAPLPKHLLPQAEGQQVLKEVTCLPPQKQELLHPMHQVNQQALELPSSPTDSLAGTLPAPLSPRTSPPVNQREATTPSLPAIGQTVTLSVTSNPTVVTTPTHPGTDQTGMLSSLIGQHTSLGPPPAPVLCPPVSFPSPPSGQVAVAPPRMGHGKAPAAQTRAVTPGGVVPSTLPVGLSVQLQPVPLPASSGPRLQTEPPIQQRTQDKPAAALAMDGNVFAFGLCPTSPKIQAPQMPAQQVHRPPVLEAPVQAVPQPRTQVTENTPRSNGLCGNTEGGETDPGNAETQISAAAVPGPLRGFEPRRALAVPVPGRCLDEQFDAVSGILLKRTKDMLKKYRQLLLGEAQQVSPSAEMVMLERLFLQAERGVLGEERRKARLDPESFLLSLRKPASGSHGAAPSNTTPFQQSNSPPSSPSWALLSDRPPGLKTYRSSSRGALKLTIKHESGSRKVVHNSACDSAFSGPSLHKQDSAAKLTNGGGILSGQVSHELWETPQNPSQSAHPLLSADPRPPAAPEEPQNAKHRSRITTEAQAAVELRTAPNPLTVSES